MVAQIVLLKQAVNPRNKNLGKLATTLANNFDRTRKETIHCIKLARQFQSDYFTPKWVTLRHLLNGSDYRIEKNRYIHIEHDTPLKTMGPDNDGINHYNKIDIYTARMKSWLIIKYLTLKNEKKETK